jgi:hypothetical protein
VAYAPTEETKRLTYGKIEAVGQENQAIEKRISELKAQSEEKVIDLEKVFRLVRVFNATFYKRPAHEQRDLLREVIKRVIITGPGTARVEYYADTREEELFPGSQSTKFLVDFSNQIQSAHPLSGVRTEFGLVDLAGQRTNSAILPDIFQLSPKTYSVPAAKLQSLYVEQGLSSNQIAAELGFSKTLILAQLKAAGLNERMGRSTRADNYRKHEPPYGFRLRDGKLVPYATEMKICHLVVELRARQQKTFDAIASELRRRGFKNRRGTSDWHHHTVGRIFARWNGKL